jgi:methylphosphotriester-DNA--protein-cysteine methyltransferase
MKTRVYHQASDADLPAEENRAYFTSVEEAEAIGYRAAGSLS